MPRGEIIDPRVGEYAGDEFKPGGEPKKLGMKGKASVPADAPGFGTGESSFEASSGVSEFAPMGESKNLGETSEEKKQPIEQGPVTSGGEILAPKATTF